jgi:hypothetical protein
MPQSCHQQSNTRLILVLSESCCNYFVTQPCFLWVLIFSEGQPGWTLHWYWYYTTLRIDIFDIQATTSYADSTDRADLRSLGLKPWTEAAGCPRTGLTNLWHACSKQHEERFAWHVTLTTVQFFSFVLPEERLCIVKNIRMHIYIYMHTHTHTHISDCLEIYELPLLPNNTVGEILLHKTGGVWSFDWIYINGAPAWRWIGEYVTLDKKFYSLIFEKVVVEVPFTSTLSFSLHCSRKPLLNM